MPTRLIIALGNPGEKYKNDRHNAGWIACDQFLSPESWRSEKKFKALIAKQSEIMFAKPLTYMNLSGDSAIKIMSYFNLLPKKWGLINKKNSDLSQLLTVVHDDLDINLGDYRLSVNSGSAGHKGVQSIINRLGTKNFTRLRLGIRNPEIKENLPTKKFVLGNFSSEELKKLLSAIKESWPKII